MTSKTQPKETGRETVVRVPLPVCDLCQKRVSRTKNQRKLHALLRTVPIYAQLLDEYPDAQVIVD